MIFKIPGKEIPYDWIMHYSPKHPCPYSAGDEVKSPVTDGDGTVFTFMGVAVVSHRIDHFSRASARTEIYVEQVRML